MMLRRYEIYLVDPNAGEEIVKRMDKSMRHAQRWIPEVLHSAIGYNKSPVGLSFVWEHGYEDTEAYKRYMVHPFHANIYDRYLLNDSPERIVINNPYDVGLLGYSCETPAYFLPSGAARRIVLLRLKEGTGDAFKVIAGKAATANDSMIQSVISENTFATRWMDGVTKMLETTTYTHIWEQGYESLADAEAAGSDWQAEAGDIVEQVIELWYEIETGEGYENDALAAARAHGIVSA